jgi:glycosyltransferase involved in cell wall biosynthesis
LGIIHHVLEIERRVLNAPAASDGQEAASQLCLFSLDWMPHPEFDLATQYGRSAAADWFSELSRNTEPFAALNGTHNQQTAEYAPAPQQQQPETGLRSLGCNAQSNGGRDPNQSATADHHSKYQLEWNTAEYFDKRGGGIRLLLAGEWFVGEEKFCWSRAPLASLLFRPHGTLSGPAAIGLLLQVTQDVALMPLRRLTVHLNGIPIWNGELRDVAGRELIIRVAERDIRPDRNNLLQFHVPEPFIPAELIGVGDSRRLGVALARLWLGRADRVSMPVSQPANANARSGEPEKLLVLRGDLRSHTGYAKATRALAALVPADYRLIGVDIHPDPADDQAAVLFSVLTETKALEQVIRHPHRCVVLHCTSPDDFSIWPNARNIGWFFWETDTIPYLREWPMRIGLMDAIWTPTTFMADFVRSAGYRGSVHAVEWPDGFAAVENHAADGANNTAASYYGTMTGRRPARQCLVSDLRGDARLLFLAVQSMAPRKGLSLLLSEWRSYIETSRSEDILILRLAFRHATGLSTDWQENFEEALAVAGFGDGGPVRVAVIPHAISEAELHGLYRSADALLSMTYGEGFGGPVLEAIQNDCPVIAPRHTGLRDLLPEDYPLTVASRRMTVALRGNLPVYPHSASWYIPDAGAVRARIEQFVAMTAAERRQLAGANKRHAMSICWAPVVRQRLAAALADLALDDAADRTPSSSRAMGSPPFPAAQLGGAAY